MRWLAWCGALVVAGVLAGCGPKESTVSPAAKPHDHSDWWCAPHGIPELECSRCSDEYAKECKAKGDWCDQHDRAKSQCFLCDPSLKEKFAARYRAKNNGDEPPAITDP